MGKMPIVGVIDTRKRRVDIVPLKKIEGVVFGKGRLFIYTPHRELSTDFRELFGMSKLIKLIQEETDVYIVDGALSSYSHFWKVLHLVDNIPQQSQREGSSSRA